MTDIVYGCVVGFDVPIGDSAPSLDGNVDAVDDFLVLLPSFATVASMAARLVAAALDDPELSYSAWPYTEKESVNRAGAE